MWEPLRHLLDAEPNHHPADGEEKNPGSDSKGFGEPGVPFSDFLRTHLEMIFFSSLLLDVDVF